MFPARFSRTFPLFLSAPCTGLNVKIHSHYSLVKSSDQSDSDLILNKWRTRTATDTGQKTDDNRRRREKKGDT